MHYSRVFKWLFNFNYVWAAAAASAGAAVIPKYLPSTTAARHSGHGFKHLTWCWWCDWLYVRGICPWVCLARCQCVSVWWGVAVAAVGCLSGSNSCTAANLPGPGFCSIFGRLLVAIDTFGLGFRKQGGKKLHVIEEQSGRTLPGRFEHKGVLMPPDFHSFCCVLWQRLRCQTVMYNWGRGAVWKVWGSCFSQFSWCHRWSLNITSCLWPPVLLHKWWTNSTVILKNTF